MRIIGRDGAGRHVELSSTDRVAVLCVTVSRAGHPEDRLVASVRLTRDDCAALRDWLGTVQHRRGEP
jgi:hypothetical protein